MLPTAIYTPCTFDCTPTSPYTTCYCPLPCYTSSQTSPTTLRNAIQTRIFPLPAPHASVPTMRVSSTWISPIPPIQTANLSPPPWEGVSAEPGRSVNSPDYAERGLPSVNSTWPSLHSPLLIALPPGANNKKKRGLIQARRPRRGSYSLTHSLTHSLPLHPSRGMIIPLVLSLGWLLPLQWEEGQGISVFSPYAALACPRVMCACFADFTPCLLPNLHHRVPTTLFVTSQQPCPQLRPKRDNPGHPTAQRGQWGRGGWLS